MEKELLSVKECATKTGFSRTYILELIHNGKISYLESGKKFLISAESIETYIRNSLKGGGIINE